METTINVGGGEESSMDVTRGWGTRPAIAAMVCGLTLLRASAGHAAIAVDSISTASGNTVSTLTWSHTVGSGSNRVLLVDTSNRDGNKTITGVTYGGTALTRRGFQNGAGNGNRVEIWSLTAPSPGTANVVVTLSGAVDVVGGAISFTGVNQTTPFGTFVSAQGTSASPSVTASSAAGQVVLDTLATDGDAVQPAQVQGRPCEGASISSARHAA